MKKLFTIFSMAVALVLVLAVASGCTAKFDASKNIAVVAREDGSGTKSAFMELIGLKGKADPSGIIIQTGSAGVLAEVKSNPVSIAYESLGYVTGDVKILKVDGVEATVSNIKNGTYKISRPLSVIYKETTLNSDINQAFLDFLKSSNAQTIIESEGFVSIVDAASAYVPNAALSGKITVGGSTSLGDFLMPALKTEFKNLQPNIEIEISGGGSGTGYESAENGLFNFGMISEEFNVTKASSCVAYTVCKDGIAVIVNKSNPLETITINELKSIYDKDAGANAIKKWDVLVK